MSAHECGCRDGVAGPASTPPGLDALRYRVGTHATFLDSLRAALSRHRLPDGRRPLDRLTTRTTDDPAIALLDAWAAVADVLTFYQERIANEGYLRTATERRSVLELARLVGYRLRPGVAASVYLAFTLDQDYRIEIPVGTHAQSVPLPGELPRFFETDEPIPARTEWNAIPARQTRPTNLAPASYFFGVRTVYAAGMATNLKTGGAILLACSGQPLPYTIQTVEPDAAANRTRVDYRPYGAEFSPNDDMTAATEGEVAGPPVTRLSSVVSALRKQPSQPPPSRFQLPRAAARTYDPAADLGPRLLSQMDHKLGDTLYTAYANASVTQVSDPCDVEALRVTAAPFGHNAPLDLVYKENVLTDRKEWHLNELVPGAATVRLTSTTEEQTAAEAFGGFHDLLTTVNPVRVEVSFAGEPGSITADVRELVRPGQEPFGVNDPEFSIILQTDSRAVEIVVAYQGTFTGDRYDDARLAHITVTFIERDSQIRVAPTESSSPGEQAPLFVITVDEDNPRSIGAGQSIEDKEGDRTVSIALNGALTVTHKTTKLASTAQFRTLALDAVYDQIVPGGHVVVDRADSQPLVARIEQARTVSRADYGITARVTQLVLDQPWFTANDTSLAVFRNTTVHAGSERLDLAEEPVPGDVTGDEIELDALYDGLDAGRWLVVRGIRSDVLNSDGEPVDGVEASELAMLAGVTQDVHRIRIPNGGGSDTNGSEDYEIELPGDTLHTRLTLSAPLAFRYRRDTVRINANVAHATHGESHSEILGSGDASKGQRFTLKKPPLTYLAAPTPKGVASTLVVRVNGVRWPEQETLLYLDGNQRGYETATDDENNTTVVFGDGTHGTRLPTGVENVTADYRSGIGAGGNVAAGRISSLATRPLGVKEVVNPQRSSGGADPEGRDQARYNVPLASRALDRLVSVRDYADFTRTFAGIGKAVAAGLSDGRRELVHLTIAGDDDVPIDLASDLYRNLLLALHQFGDPRLPLLVAPREAVFLVLSARVRILPDHRWDLVEPRVRTALLDTFGFARRELAQDVLLSEVIGAVQAIEGVDYVDVDLLDGITETDDADPAALAAKLATLAAEHGRPKQRLAVEEARVVTGAAPHLRPAQLAYLNPRLPDTLILTDVTP